MPDTFSLYRLKSPQPFRLAAISYTDDPASLGELADRVGKLRAAEADLKKEIDRLREMFVASGQREAEGALFRVSLGAEAMQSTVDRKALENEMGERWLARFLKWSPRAGAFTCTARKERAA